jgi:hypothetical protein
LFVVVVWLGVFDWCNVDCWHVVCCLDVQFWETSLVLNETLKVGWRVLIPALVTKPNTALVMNVFTKETKLCPAFPSPDEAAADWTADERGCYTVKVER